MKVVQVRFEVRDRGDGGWLLFAVPENGGFAPVAMTKQARGAATGALVEFATQLWAITEQEPHIFSCHD